MRGCWRLPVCVAAVVLAHAGLMAAWLRASPSGIRRPPPHRMAPVRLVVLADVEEPRSMPPASPPPAEGGVAPAGGVPAMPSPSPSITPGEPPGAPTRPALAPEPEASSPPSPQVPTVAPVREFLSPAQVDRGAIAFPSPDIGSLAGLTWSGVPIRLRLFVDASGQCIDVQVLRASEDAATLERVRQMFLATHFLPAQRAGEGVASYRDIELDVSDVK